MAELSGITIKGNLIEEDKWKSHISSMENNFDNLEIDLDKSKRVLKEKLTKAIEIRAKDKFGVLFSGGIDSTLIAFVCNNLNKNFNCYTVGMENSPDMKYAEKVSAKLNLNLRTRVLTLEDIEILIKKVASIIKEPDTVKISVGAVTYAGCQMADKYNTHTIFSGLGSEEIFAGYERHWQSFNGSWKNIHEECWSGLKQMWSRDFQRDHLMSKKNNMSILLPFLDKEVITAAMNIHPKYKINESDKKIILREVAQDLGLPREFCWRKKKAAQYGSYIQKAIEKLTKKAGFKYVKDYLRSLL